MATLYDAESGATSSGQFLVTGYPIRRTDN